MPRLMHRGVAALSLGEHPAEIERSFQGAIDLNEGDSDKVQLITVPRVEWKQE
jgi:hypothetical protein